MQDEESRKNLQRVAVFMTIPFVLAIPPILGWLLGGWFDKLCGTTPYLMYLFLIIGFLAGIREFIRIIRRYGDGN